MPVHANSLGHHALSSPASSSGMHERKGPREKTFSGFGRLVVTDALIELIEVACRGVRIRTDCELRRTVAIQRHPGPAGVAFPTSHRSHCGTARTPISNGLHAISLRR